MESQKQRRTLYGGERETLWSANAERYKMTNTYHNAERQTQNVRNAIFFRKSDDGVLKLINFWQKKKGCDTAD